MMSALWLVLQDYGSILLMLAIGGFTLRVAVMMIRDVRGQRRRCRAITLLHRGAQCGDRSAPAARQPRALAAAGTEQT